MSHRVVAAAVLLATIACVAACKKGKADVSASAPSMTAGELCDAVFGAAERQLAARCTPGDQERKQDGYLLRLGSGAVSRCKEELEPMVARGSVRLDAEAARRCGKFLEATSWKETLASPDVSRFAACRGLVLGAVTEGQPCVSGVECSAGLSCAGSGGPQGRCEKPGGVAPVCTRTMKEVLGASGACGPGAYCPIASRPSTALGAPAEEPDEARPSASADAPAEAPSDGDTARHRALREAEEFGLLGLLGTGAAGIDAVDAPEGIGLGGLGLGRPGGTRGTRGSKPPTLRMGTTMVSGRLPPEVIQRIVRESFGRFRLCYENGLRTDPRLAGRVSVKFVIGRAGEVSTVGNAGSDLPDRSVVACIVRAFYALRFPAPEGGIVTVTYPLLFSSTEGADAGADAPAPATPPAATAAPAPAAHDGEAAQATCAPLLAAGQDCKTRDACGGGLACRVHRCSSDPPAGPGGACMEEDDCRPDLYCKRPQVLSGGGRGVCAAHKPEGAACASSLQCGGICLSGKCAAFCGAR